jgi:hypothetical protein
MKIDTRKDCKRMGKAQQDCYLLLNKAIPTSTMESDDDDDDDSSSSSPLGRHVAYEPYLIHSPVLTSARIRGKKAAASANARISKKYMRKLNDAVFENSMTVDELADSIGALTLSKGERESEAAPPPPCAKATENDLRQDPPTVSSSEGGDQEEDSEGTGRPSVAGAEILGRVQLKVIDEATNEEVVVSRCVRFFDTEEVEI